VLFLNNLTDESVLSHFFFFIFGRSCSEYYRYDILFCWCISSGSLFTCITT